MADDAARTVTITLAAAGPFVLNGLTDLPIVCAAGMADRTALASATLGSGPYVLSEAAPGDHYTYTIRDGYTWGPDGASTDVEGMPDTIVVRIVENPSTAANLLLTGDVNAAHRRARTPQRLAAEDLFSTDTPGPARRDVVQPRRGSLRPPTPPSAWRSLQAVDLAQLQQVLTAGQGLRSHDLRRPAPGRLPR